MSIQITTTKQKVEFSKMVKDYKIRYYNLGPSVLYVDYVDSTGTRTETVPAYGSFTVMSNAGNAANSYLNLYTSSGITNIVVSKIQQDCAVDGTDLFGNVITAVDPADVASLLQKTTNMAASSGVTTFAGTVSAADFAAISSISVGSVELTEESLQEIETNISNLLTSVASVSSKTQNLTASTGVSTFSGTLNAENFVTSGSVSVGAGLDVDGVATLNDGFTYNDGTNTWLLNETGLSESGSSGELFSVMSGNVECQKLTAANQINIPNVVSFASSSNGGVVFSGSDRIRVGGGFYLGPVGTTYGIDINGNAALAQCNATIIFALGSVSGATFEGTASGYDYFEVSPGICKLPSGNPQSGTYGYKHWFGDVAQYTAIAEKDVNTFYHVVQVDKSVLTYYGK